MEGIVYFGGMKKLDKAFYQQTDVVDLARQLLGKYLFCKVDDMLCGGMIVETEAYKGPEDRGSHAYLNKRTPRNETMYAAGGKAYVYTCYGIHDLFNVVTGVEGSSHAILIRGLEPTEGIETMLERRKMEKLKPTLTAGPGALGKALGITKALNAVDLTGNEVWIEDRNVLVPENEICSGARIGMNFEGPYKTIPWRFWIKGNRYVSKPWR